MPDKSTVAEIARFEPGTRTEDSLNPGGRNLIILLKSALSA